MEAESIVAAACRHGLRSSPLTAHRRTQRHPPRNPLSKENIYFSKKLAKRQHALRALPTRELARTASGFETEAPIEATVRKEAVTFTEQHFSSPYAAALRITHYVISINRRSNDGGEGGSRRHHVFKVLLARTSLQRKTSHGVRTDDKGVDKRNEKKSNFEPGYASCQSRNSGEAPADLHQELIAKLTSAATPTANYGVGVKNGNFPGRIDPGEVHPTLGYRLRPKSMAVRASTEPKQHRLAGFVTGLDYQDPRLDPIGVSKNSSATLHRKLLKGGSMIRYGAKSFLTADGGRSRARRRWFYDHRRFRRASSIPRASKAFTRQKSAYCAQTAFEALLKNDSSVKTCLYPKRIDQSWIREELWKVRNFHQRLREGLYAGLITPRSNKSPSAAAHARYPPRRARNLRQLAALPSTAARRAFLGDCKGDGNSPSTSSRPLHSGTSTKKTSQRIS